MFKFNKSDVSYEFIGLLSISKATIEPKIKYIDSNGVERKALIPTAVARRARSNVHGVSAFSKAYPACIVIIDNRIVALETANPNQLKMYLETEEWISNIEKNIELVRAYDDTHLWDGQYIYDQVGEVEQFGGDESSFGSVKCKVLDTYKLSDEKVAPNDTFSGLAYLNPQTNDWVITPPVVRQMGQYIALTEDADEAKSVSSGALMDEEDPLARLDRNKFPNLRFVNYAARVVAERFGYDSIEPLGLPLLMIEHRTFNLGGLETGVQMSSKAPFAFSQGLAWCIGLMKNVKCLDDLVAVKSTIKMFMSKGNSNIMTSAKKADEVGQNTKNLIDTIRKRNESAPLLQFSTE